jgi:hypothetical protein
MENLILYTVPLEKERIGKPFDGGYVIYDLPGSYDIVISGGISNDISFEQAIVEKFPCTPCMAFDGTIPNLPEDDYRIYFVKKNLGKENTESLSNLHKEIEPFSNIFMKMDIEGHEFRLFPTFSDEQMNKIKQLVIEIHSPGDIQLHPTYFTGLSDITNETMFALFKKITRTHTLVHVHPNNGCKTYTIDGISFPNVFECTFIRNEYVTSKTPNTESLPLSIDMPNIPQLPVVIFDSYPFTKKNTPEPVKKSLWNELTLVTCLVNIGREEFDGRKFEDYIKWFVPTIQIPAPMVIYVEPALVSIVRQVRGNLPTKIIEETVQTIPLAWSIGFVQQILESKEWKEKIIWRKDLTNRLPTYAPMIHSKMAYMLNVMKENPFKTDLFFWIDGGLSRFWKKNHITAEPRQDILTMLRETHKIYIQIGGDKDHLVAHALGGTPFTFDQMIGTNQNLLMGGFWGGQVEHLKDACEFVLRTYITEMLMKKRIDTEQTSIFFHAQKYPDKYLFIAPVPEIDVYNFELFTT